MGYYVGIDVGGTFPDICVANQDGKISVYKTLTLPDIGSGVIEGLRLAAEAERLDLPAFLVQGGGFGHGTTGAGRAIRELLDEGIESLAVCTLWSFRNPVHERMLREIALELAPNLYVSVSSDLVPVIKEYERMATTVANAYLGPVVNSYIAAMGKELKASGFGKEFFMLNSVGGVIPPMEAGAKPIQLLGSGPSGGALASQLLARQIGQPNVIIADMGGTSFDAGLIVEGELLLQTETVVGNLNLLSPMIGIRSIGTGGGRIAVRGGGRL